MPSEDTSGMPKEIVDSFDAIMKLLRLDLNDCYLSVSGQAELPDALIDFDGAIFPEAYRLICSKLLFHSLGIRLSEVRDIDSEVLDHFSECVWDQYKSCLNEKISKGDK